MTISAKRTLPITLLTVAGALCGFPCGLSAIGQESANPPGKDQADERNRADLIRGYKKWTKANAKPVLMQPAAAAQCAAPWPHQQASPHLQKYVTVYVNAPGQAAMLREKQPKFPAGTVIVKEKLSHRDSKTPELMTVMVKREASYDAENGNWEYLVFDGTGTQTTAFGKIEKCQSCHAQSPANQSDHVFRNYYLSQNQLAAMH